MDNKREYNILVSYKKKENEMTETKHKCTSWAIVCTIERPDGTWFDKTIIDIPDDVSQPIDDWLTHYMEEEYDN